MRRVLCGLFLLAASMWPATPRAEAPTMFVEAQSWNCPSGKDLMLCAHQHVGGWLPFYQIVSGLVEMDIDRMHHLACGYSDLIKGAAFEDRQIFKGDPLTTTPKLSETYPWNTANVADGWTGWDVNRTRFKDCDGTMWFARLKGGMIVDNGRADNGVTKPPELLSSAWHSDERGYSNVMIPGTSAQTLVTPKPGPWSLSIQVGSSRAGEVRDMVIALDPDVHNGNFGKIIFERLNVPKDVITYQIPAMPAGFHKLMIRSSDNGRFGPRTMVGVLVVGYNVP